jgi:hypothetical protein
VGAVHAVMKTVSTPQVKNGQVVLTPVPDARS